MTKHLGLKVCYFIGKWCKWRNTLAKNWM